MVGSYQQLVITWQRNLSVLTCSGNQIEFIEKEVINMKKLYTTILFPIVSDDILIADIFAR